MRNRFLTILFCLLTVFAFSQVANAQCPADPEGAPDALTIDCGTNVYPGGVSVTVNFNIKFPSDNTGTNKVQAFGVPLIISGANRVSVDTTVATAFAGSAAGAFAILAVSKADNPDPTVTPFHMAYGAVNFTGGITGANQQYAVISVQVNDTGTICIDSMSTLTLAWCAGLTTEAASGFGPAG